MPSSASNPSSTEKTIVLVSISVGVELLFLLAMGLFRIHFRRQRRLDSEAKGSPQAPGLRYNMGVQLAPRGRSSLTAGDYRHGPFYTMDHKQAAAAAAQHSSVPQTLPDQPTPADFASNAEYYDQMEIQMGSSQTESSTRGSGQSIAHQFNSAMPIHPAYVPRTHARPSRQSPPVTGGLPPAPKYYKPDAFAAQGYLDAAEEATGVRPATPPLPVEPPAPAYAAVSPPVSLPPHPGHHRMSAASGSSRTTPTSSQPSVSPPPVYTPPGTFPALILPVPGGKRMAKRFTPPRLVSLGSSSAAASVASGSESGSPPPPPPPAPGSGRGQQHGDAVLDISSPLHSAERAASRISGPPAGAARLGRFSFGSAVPEHVVEHTVVRRPLADVPIASGKSLLYG